LKKFTVCYTLDNDIITEKMIKELDANKEDIEQEVVEKMDRNKYFIVKNDQENYLMNTNLVRYVRI
jgi:hypothetical protein